MLEHTILSELVFNEDYCRKVLPHLKPKYFKGSERLLFKLISEYLAKYNTLPTPKTLLIELEKQDAPDSVLQSTAVIIDTIENREKVEQKWLVDATEEWCRTRSVHIAINDAIEILSGQNQKVSQNAIPDILKDALGVTFDTRVGHDYLGDFDARYDFYNRNEERISFNLELLDKITKGGITNKSLTIILAGTGSGKSLFMCNHAASCLKNGKNVLYITLEMSEERIAERIDANLMDVDINEIANLPRETFTNKVQKIAQKTQGRLIIKEYPPVAAHVGHYRALLNELKTKKKFIPDILFLDYLNISASSRIKSGSDSYSMVKSIAEEVRGLAVEFDIPVVTATQTNRSGYDNSDVELTEVSESFGVAHTADLLFALISTEELQKMNQILVKQLKNRYNDTVANKRFVLGINRAKMKIYDLEDSAQDSLVNSSSSSTPSKPASPNALPPFKKKTKGDFSNIKFD